MYCVRVRAPRALGRSEAACSIALMDVLLMGLPVVLGTCRRTEAALRSICTMPFVCCSSEGIPAMRQQRERDQRSRQRRRQHTDWHPTEGRPA